MESLGLLIESNEGQRDRRELRVEQLLLNLGGEGVVAESTLPRLCEGRGPGSEAGTQGKFHPLQNVPRPALKIDTIFVA